MGSVVHVLRWTRSIFTKAFCVLWHRAYQGPGFDRVVFDYPSDCPSWIKGNATARGRVDHIKFNDILIMGERVLNAADMNLYIDSATTSDISVG